MQPEDLPDGTGLEALSMTEAADLVARGEVTAVALTEACLHRIGLHGAALNAVVRVDAERALDAAAAVDRARSDGRPLGPLAGVPMAHKDMYYRAGEISTCGSSIRAEFRPPVTATVLQRLDAAGAIQLGTLNMAEFAQNPTGHNAHLGDAHNPWNPDYITGGSSSGSGVAVAARMAYAALGSDTGGSIRLPAAICGVTGLKPTQTRVSRHGVMPLSFTCDNVGPLARTARDCARFLRVIAGQDPADPTSARLPVPDYEAALDGDLRGTRIAVPGWFLDGADAPVLAAFTAALEVLRARGAAITHVPVPVMPAVAAYGSIISRVEGSTIHARWMRERPADYAPHLGARLYGGYAIPATYYVEALSRRGPLLRRFVAEALSGHDLVATPTIRTRVPTLAETDVDAGGIANWPAFMALTRNTRPFNNLGLPAISVPCGHDDRGLPIGLQLAARPFAEARVLHAADAYQRDTDWHARPPPLG